MCVQAQKFFSPGAGGLVESATPDPDELILNCYRLADRYKQDPMLFLNKPTSEINNHIAYTIKLIDAQRAAREREAPVDDDE